MVNAALVEGEACGFVVFDLQLYYGYLASLYIWMWSTVTNVTPDAGVARFFFCLLLLVEAQRAMKKAILKGEDIVLVDSLSLPLQDFTM